MRLFYHNVLNLHNYLFIREHAFSGHGESGRIIIDGYGIDLTRYKVTSQVHAPFEEGIDLAADLACYGLNIHLDAYGVAISLRIQATERGAGITKPALDVDEHFLRL